jgi:hypothetical protein
MIFILSMSSNRMGGKGDIIISPSTCAGQCVGPKITSPGSGCPAYGGLVGFGEV